MQEKCINFAKNEKSVTVGSFSSGETSQTDGSMTRFTPFSVSIEDFSEFDPCLFVPCDFVQRSHLKKTQEPFSSVHHL